jgi:two-component system nitrate/nitrite response regulator NarL
MSSDTALDRPRGDVAYAQEFSPREMEVLRLLAQGTYNKQIAHALGIAEATVKVHVKSLLRKMRVLNRTQAAVWALNNGLVRI